MLGLFFYDGGLSNDSPVPLLECSMNSFDPRLIAVRSAHFIDGQYRDAHSGLEVVRPSDGQVYAELPVAELMPAEVVERGHDFVHYNCTLK